MAFSRQLTSTEKIYVASDHIMPPCVNTIILEGMGQWDPEEWARALGRAGKANPGSRLVMKSSLFGGQWVDSGRPPALSVVDGSFRQL